MEQTTICWLNLHSPAVMELEESILPEGFRLLRPKDETDMDEVHHLMEQADYLIAMNVSREEMQHYCKRVRLIQKWGIGVDGIDLDAARELGVPVYNTSGANSTPVAELAVALMLSCCRRIPYVDRTVREGLWIRNDMRAQCMMLNGKTIGLLGMGNIARKVAKMVSGFAPKRILYYDTRRADPEVERELNISYTDIDTLCREADILSLHVPLNRETEGIINAERLDSMKETAILINTARGGLVDEAALANALLKRKIFAAGLDAFSQEPIQQDSPFLSMDNVVLTCHCGGGVIDNVLNVTQHAFQNIVNHRQGLPPVKQTDIIVGSKN